MPSKAHITTLLELTEVTVDYNTTEHAAQTTTSITVVDQGPAIGHFHPVICQLTNLVNLNLAGNSITYIPYHVTSLMNLETLNLSRNAIGSVAREIGQLSNLLELDVSRNNITKLPEEICALSKLKVLNAYSNGLTELPAGFGQLVGLKRLGLKSNRLVRLPPSFSCLTNLVELFTTDNQLTELPEGLPNLSSLVKLQASFNSFTHLPGDLFQLPRLEMARFAVCNITSIPQQLLHNCTASLAWCNLGGNPLCSVLPAARPDVAVLPGSVVSISGAEKLGDGASGEVFRATWEGKPVAVKVFRSDVSPDGRTQEEVAIACSVDHNRLARVVALQQEPLALLMDVVQGKPLAEKPLFEPLLRCRWAAGASFQAWQVALIGEDIASALAYLHSQRLCHGDVYAHNVLVDEDSHATLVDLGAAFHYPPGEGFWQAMEVRAFGLMLSDLVARIGKDAQCSSPLEGDHNGRELAQKELASLADHCTHAWPEQRRSFAELATALSALHLQLQ